MPPLVLDASLVVAALLPDERAAEAAGAVLDEAQLGGAVVPALWLPEVANALLAAARRRRIAAAHIPVLLLELAAIPQEVDILDAAALRLAVLPAAQRHALTIYDACYLELAIRRALPLGSLDAELRKAARAEGVPVAPALDIEA